MVIAGYEIGTALHRSRLRSVYPAVRRADGLAVVIKTLDAEYPNKRNVAELRREFHITKRLQSVAGVIRVQALEPHGNGNIAIVSERFGRSLTQLIAAGDDQAAPFECFFNVAISVAETLARVHELDVVHKNIEPNSILIDGSGALRVIDFGIASELSLERQRYVSEQIEGALPYISPEQTGRMNRDLDYRSDFYSLGATLYELLTGQPPFQAGSVLEWVHCHISKLPRSPSEINPSIPEPISAIVLKLMAKNAEERYQSSYGLIDDLRRCQRQLTQTGAVARFGLGVRDVSRKFSIPQRLYGREPEVAVLLSLIEQVAAGGAEFCMVSGYSGVGKSALVNEISKPLVRQRGYLIQGKFDQFQRSTPYSVLGVALRSLVEQLLTEPAERQHALRETIQAALTPNGRLLIELIPDLESIIGPQPPVPELPSTEAQNRFLITLIHFLRIIASRQPLVIFLDDLQFSDAPTLDLIRRLATARDLANLLVIGAYRSNEVDVGHPLRLALDEIQASRSIHELALHPLELSSVEQLVADTLHTDADTARPLSLYLHEKTQGNPFFLGEMLRTLEQNRTIAFAPATGRWRWDMEAVQRSGVTHNVVDFIVTNLRKLPPAAQRVLQLAACIGNTFDLRTLSIIYEKSMDEAGEELLPALQRHMVIPLHEDYKLVGKASGAATGAVWSQRADFNPTYRFQHDRVQQAAYALVGDEDKQTLHLSVGRLIQRHASAQERDERLIEIVGHLNEGRALIADPAERGDLARSNLVAGIRAQRSAAYEAALGYLKIGLELLPNDPWGSDYELTMALATEYQQCAYLTARYDEAESWIEDMLARARYNLEKAAILSMRTRQYATTGKMDASIRTAIAGLALLEMRMTNEPSLSAINRAKREVKRHLAGRRVSDLITAPMLSDPSKKVAIRLLMEIFPAAFLSGSGNLFPFLVLKSVNISLRYGNSAESAFAYAAYGMLLCGSLDDPALGYEFGRLALAMNDRFDDIALKSRVIYVHAMFIHHWSNHWSTMTPWFRKGIESGYQSGDMLYLAYSAQDCIIWDPTLDLETAAKEHADYLKIVKDCRYQDSFDSGMLFLQMQRNFLGLTDELCSMNDASFSEERSVAGMRARKFMTGVANYQIYKAEICFFYGRYDEALAHVRAQDLLIASSMSLPQLVRFYIVAFLTLAACLPGMNATEKEAARKRMNLDLKRMRRWATHCPTNFLHLQMLMQAELARLDGRADLALRFFDRAIEAARASGFRRDEAMASELAARHLLSTQRRTAAVGYLRAARHLYERWGARRKVDQLEEEFPALLREKDAREGGGPSGLGRHPTTSMTAGVHSLDMTSVMKATRAISSEIVLEQLWTTTMRIMLENAGGQRGCFVIRKEGRLVIEGLNEIARDEGAAARSIGVEVTEGALALPISVVYHVLNTNSPVVVNEPSGIGRFARDAYVLARKPQSMLCIPLTRQGKFEGAIYMENCLAAGVFTEERIEIIKLLAAQVSISMENAKLYEEQRNLIEAQRRFVPRQFLENLGRYDIARVELGEHVAKTIGVMFADLRGFTSLAERLDPRTVIDLMNRFFVAMETEIIKAGGFIESFAGDEIRALFDTTADASVWAGIGMWRTLEAFNQRSGALGQPELQMGVGVNMGPLVLGIVGGHHRMQCSVIGDTVNLSSRIEQLTKVYRGRLLIGEQTFHSLNEPSAFAIRMVDRVAVKGKDTAVTLYEVIDAETPDRRAAKLGTLALLQSAMEQYYAREFKTAQEMFHRMSREDPLDAIPVLFAERCSRYLLTPPPDKWQGFEKLMEK